MSSIILIFTIKFFDYILTQVINVTVIFGIIIEPF